MPPNHQYIQEHKIRAQQNKENSLMGDLTVTLFFYPKVKEESIMPKIIYTSHYMRDAPPSCL